MADIFLNLANFAQHTILTLSPCSSYILYPKALIKVLKVTEHLRYQIKYCDLHLKENAEKTNFISPQKLLQKVRIEAIKIKKTA